MKKVILFIVAVVCLCSEVMAQKENSGFRKQRPAETDFFNNLHQALFESLPHQYKDWITAKEDSFSALKMWCSTPVSWRDCTGDIIKTEGVTDPYNLNWSVEFNMPNDQSANLMVAAFKTITDYTNGTQIAKALKGTNRTKLTISVYANTWITQTGTFVVSYCAKTPPVAIVLPVPATLALKGTRSVGCPIMSGGTVNLSGSYYDSAVIFLGKTVAYTNKENTDDGLTDNRYDIAFDKTKIGKLIVQNIVVTIKGDSADIDEAIKLVDWQKLYGLIAKE